MTRIQPARLSLTLRRPEAVRLLGVSDRTFARLEAEGVVRASRPGRGRRGSVYDAYALVPAYVAHRERRLRGGEASGRERRDRSLAELNELRLQERRGALVSRRQVVDEGKTFVIALRARLLGLPRLLIQRGVIPADQDDLVRQLVRDLLHELSGWSTHDVLGWATREGEAPPTAPPGGPDAPAQTRPFPPPENRPHPQGGSARRNREARAHRARGARELEALPRELEIRRQS